MHNGLPHFRVETTSATYLIEKQSGGCASLIDREGRDWVAFKKTGNDNPTNSADSDYRGIPNLVFRDPGNGIGHPGFNVCETRKVAENQLLVTSKDGQWQFRWIFQAPHAELAVERTDPDRNYWFLYEGPVAGRFSPSTHYWGNDVDGLRTDQPSIFTNPQGGQWRWAFFGDKTVDETLFVIQATPDEAPDYFTYMGNDRQRENLSADGMNVFGFGRGLNTNPTLSGPNRFLIGLYPAKLNEPAQLKIFRDFLQEVIAEER